MSAETRDRIIQAGNQAMLEKSYNGAGLNEILKIAGVPKGSFYHHFASKEDLGVCIVNQCADEHTQRLRAFFSEPNKTPLERLRSKFEWGRTYLIENGYTVECLIFKLAMELATLSDPVRASIRCAMDQWRSLTAQCIREAQHLGEIPEHHDPEALADFMIAAWEGVFLRVQVDREIRAADDFLHFIFECLLAK
ncbi:Transcriptional regulator AcuR [Planctomycetes bacterium Pan216]|uniref:Transcriptional regulator AcuR n=1 Tax=Kolteria novifilia TaxID=2527975 RepID=A0A518BCE0_9BACT|nr:Transcriptional regulator AcuR [Planctomycetes bacterium Pan216]